MDFELLTSAVHFVVLALEVAGVVVIAIGALVGLVQFARQGWSAASDDRGVQQLRTDLGRAILLGLEFLVAADIINTVAIEPTLDSLAVLAGIVAIRTFLSFALEVEIEGTWPWARAQQRERLSDGSG